MFPTIERRTLRLSGSPTHLQIKAAHQRVRSKRFLTAACRARVPWRCAL